MADGVGGCESQMPAPAPTATNSEAPSASSAHGGREPPGGIGAGASVSTVRFSGSRVPVMKVSLTGAGPASSTDASKVSASAVRVGGGVTPMLGVGALRRWSGRSRSAVRTSRWSSAALW